MAKANAGGGKESGSSDAGDAYDPPAAENRQKNPEAELQRKQIDLALLKAAEKRLQDEIGRLTAHATTMKTLDGQLSEASIDAMSNSRKELTTFVATVMKALDADTTKKIASAKKESDDDISDAGAAYDQAVKDREANQVVAATKQGELSEATKTYAAAKDVTARVKQATTDLQGLRQRVEALVKANQFVAAGFWLFELEQQLKAAPVLEKARQSLSSAWQVLQTASIAAGAADDALIAAAAWEVTTKKALDDANKNRVAGILEKLEDTAAKAVA